MTPQREEVREEVFYHLSYEEAARAWKRNKVGIANATRGEWLGIDTKLDMPGEKIQLGLLMAILTELQELRRKDFYPGSEEAIHVSLRLEKSERTHLNVWKELMKTFRLCGQCRVCKRIKGAIEVWEPARLYPFETIEEYNRWINKYMSKVHVMRRAIKRKDLTVLEGIGKKSSVCIARNGVPAVKSGGD
jgi:hypothetical protein